MGMMDDMTNDIKNKGEDLMKDPGTKAKIEQIAKDKGMSIDQAKEHFMKQGNQGK